MLRQVLWMCYEKWSGWLALRQLKATDTQTTEHSLH